MDISSLNDGTGYLNTDHLNPDSKIFQDKKKEDPSQWGTVVGRIVFAKKIFNESDCESIREKNFWGMIQVPFLYIACELFDNDDHLNAKELVAIVKAYQRRNLPILVRYSVEGSTLVREGNVLKQTIARRIAATCKPCMHSAYSGVVAFASNPQQIAIQKSEMDINPYISIFEMEYNPLVQERDPVVDLREALQEFNNLNKAFTLGSSNAAPGSLTGGAAVSKEDVGKNVDLGFIKSQVLAAFRDWDRTSSFKQFLKHRLPDVDEKIVDRFSEMAGQIQFTKAEETQACGDCYRYAYNKIKQFPNSTLVHGEVQDPWSGKKFSHAWIEHGGGQIDDWQSSIRGKGLYDSEKFYNQWKPSNVKKYNQTQAQIKAVKTGHYGPWHGEVTKSEKDLSKMAMVHDDAENPLTVYRVQNVWGKGPYNNTNTLGLTPEQEKEWFKSPHFNMPPPSVYGSEKDIRPSPGRDFSSDEQGFIRGGRSSLLFGFEHPDHATAWFGEQGLAGLKRFGFSIVPVKAKKVYRSLSSKQVMFEPHESNQFTKSEILQKHDDSLVELDTKPPKGAKIFRNKHVIPGEIELISGPYQGSKLKLMGMTDDHVFVQPFKASDQKHVKVNKMNRKHEGIHYIVSKHPEELSLPNYIHGENHGDPFLNEHPEQKELIHGINLAHMDKTSPHGATKARAGKDATVGWFKSASGKEGYVKPAVRFDSDEIQEGDPRYLSTARREVVYHNLAKSFFNLGEHVPTTALFKHPETGRDHSVMEKIPFATHIQKPLKGFDNESVNRLAQAGDNGTLDKLAIMDITMGSSDRNRFNYMSSPNPPSIHLIDNSLIFGQDTEIPGYIHDYQQIKGQNLESSPMHPMAVKYLLSLDPFALGAELIRQNVHPEIAQNTAARLLSMQSSALMGKHSRSDILFSHSRFMEGRHAA